MKIRAHAPGRCGIVGNPTDMYGGCVLSCTTQERAFCELEPRGEETLFQNEDQHSLVRSKEDLRLQGDKLDILRAAFAYFDIDPGALQFRYGFGRRYLCRRDWPDLRPC